MEQLQSKTLAQIVNENHQATNVFEKWGLDFCCRGKRSLQFACEEKKLPLEEISADLQTVINQQIKRGIEFGKMPLTELIDYIVYTHHAYVKKEAPQIFSYLHKVSAQHGDRHNELYAIFETFSELKEELESHMQKEELLLFPRIAALENGKNNSDQRPLNYLQSPVSIMEHEHDDAGKLLEKLRRLTNNYQPPADACTTYRVSFAALRSFEIDLHQHIHLENNLLFSKALELFRQTKQAALK